MQLVPEDCLQMTMTQEHISLTMMRGNRLKLTGKANPSHSFVPAHPFAIFEEGLKRHRMLDHTLIPLGVLGVMVRWWWKVWDSNCHIVRTEFASCPVYNPKIEGERESPVGW